MPQTTFPCPFCGKKMGVGPELLGRQVRCPHCKQVVLAPAGPAAPPPPPVVMASPALPTPPARPSPVPGLPPGLPVFNIPSPDEQDSIFGAAPPSGDAVFGYDAQTVPVMPPPLTPPPPPVVAPVLPPPVAAAPPPADPFAGYTAGSTYPTPVSFPVPVLLPPAPPPAAPANPWAALAPPPAPPVYPPPVPVPVLVPVPVPEPEPMEAVIADDEPPPPPRRERRPERDDRDRDDRRPERPRPAAAGGGGGMVFKVGFFLLVPYALLMTVLAAYGLFGRSGVPSDHPLSLIPDGTGQYPPADRKKTGRLGVPLDGPLPPELRAGIGGKVAVGAVEVEPVAVEVRPLTVVKELDAGGTAPVRLADGLSLTLRVRNTSPDLTFHPLDPAFNRKQYADDAVPTKLVVGKSAFAGGAVRWPFEKGVKRAYEQRQAGEDAPLKPGEAREYVVTSDGRADVVRAVRGAKEGVTWRVQVRRGLVSYRGREVPVTALIGVEFTAADVRQAE